MGKRLDTRRGEEDKQAPEQVVKRSPDWRAQERAKTLLFSDGSVVHAHCWRNSTAQVFLGFVGEQPKRATKPLAIVIDNASIHRARAIQPALKLRGKTGTRLKFLPPYSPEHNRIETLWRLMKHRWIALTRRTKEAVEQAVDHVLDNFGGQFKVDF